MGQPFVWNRVKKRKPTMASQDDYSDIQQEVSLDEDRKVDPADSARGHKAVLSNPQMSQQAKEHSRAVLENELQEPYDEMGGDKRQDPPQSQKDPGNIARGLKASINNPGVSSEA